VRNLEDVLELIEEARERKNSGAKQDAILTEISVALVDILKSLDESGPSVAKAIMAGLAGMKHEPPQVTLNVEPTPITIQNNPPAMDFKPNIEVKAVMPKDQKPPWSELDIAFTYQQSGNDMLCTSAKVTKKK
jgi:D-alanyl-D-alanine carboxypeptidase